MMRRILKFFYRNIIPSRLRSSMDIFQQLRTGRIEGLTEKRVLVLSPHPDDDIIGCGGAIHIYHKMGAEITVAYITDGRKGNPGYDEDDLVRLRKEEAGKAAAVIGVDRLIFLDNRDSELVASPKTVKEISGILADLEPEAVFLPFLMDNHPDHMATNDIFVEASRAYGREIMCYGYEVWTPLSVPNCVIDITVEMPKKVDALKQHKSQMTEFSLIDAAVGLSRYRGVLHFLKDRYAEAFVRCSLYEYRRLWEVIR